MFRKRILLIMITMLFISILTACNANRSANEGITPGNDSPNIDSTDDSMDGSTDDSSNESTDDSMDGSTDGSTDENTANTAEIAPSPDISIVPNNLWTVTDGITMRLAQDYYPPNPAEMTLILENRSDSVMLYGQGWFFEKFEEGEWRGLKTIENYGFTAEGYHLYDHDKKTLRIWTGFLDEPLDVGLYRVTGSPPCLLRVAADDQNLSYGMNYVDYPPYQLEFVISQSASAEPGELPEETFVEWQLPEIESWQFYTSWDCVRMYENAGMQLWQFVQGNNGLIAVLYRSTKENEYLNAGDLLLMDLFDRKTGKRYEVFTEPSVETEAVTPFEDGFNVDCGDLLFCFIDDFDTVRIVGSEIESDADLKYSDLADIEFWFGSGVGAWSTVVYILPDGTFNGYFHDSDMGVYGDDYPNGTRYECFFSGKFSSLKKTGEHAYSMIASL